MNKKRFFIICILFLLIGISQAQNCKDTLFVQIKNAGTVVNLEDDYKPLKGDTLSQQKTPKLYLVTNVLFLKDYKSFDSLDLEYLLTYGDDTLLCSSSRKRVYGDYRSGENEEYVHHQLQINNWQNGEYNFSIRVLGSSVDGVFCDSIQNLSAFQCVFYLDKTLAVAHIKSAVVKVFPNPASEQLNVTCGEEMRSIALFNPTGQRVRQMEPCGTEVQVPLSGLPRGLYLLRVQTASGSAVRKVVVE